MSTTHEFEWQLRPALSRAGRCSNLLSIDSQLAVATLAAMWTRWWKSRESMAFDPKLVIALALLDGWRGLLDDSHTVLPGPALGALSGLLALALVVRRRFPEAVAYGYALAAGLFGLGGLGLLAAFYSLGAHGKHRQARWLGQVLTTWLAPVTYAASLQLDSFSVDRESSATAYPYPALVVVTALLLGLYVGVRRDLLSPPLHSNAGEERTITGTSPEGEL